MAEYTSINLQDRRGIAAGGSSGAVLMAHARVTCAAAPSTSDTLRFFYLPAGARVLMAILEATVMDSGEPTLTLNIGDTGSGNRLFAASTVAQDGSASTAIAATGAGYKYDAKTMITGTAAANADEGAAGTVDLTVLYTID